MESKDSIAKDQKTVEALRETFAPVTERLTPDVEPATIYLLSMQLPEPDANPRQDK
jgi:hypothetical protein